MESMDNLVLIRVAAALQAGLDGAVLRDLQEESRQRFRLIFDREAGPATLIVSLRPEQPWAGRPAGLGEVNKEVLWFTALMY